MPRVTFDVTEHKAFADWVKKGLDKAARRGAFSAAMRTLSEIQNVLIPREDPQPVDTGAYRAAWQVEQTPEGAAVYNTLPYAPVIEYGARPENVKIGRKMIDALKKWVLRKGLLGPVNKKSVDTDAQAESVAWAIAVSMKKRGIFNPAGRKGLRVAERAARFAATILAGEVEAEVRKELGG